MNQQQQGNDVNNNRLEGVVSLIQPPLFKTLTWLILTLVLSSLVFLSMGSYARKERVSGILQPSSGLLKLSAGQSGIISELLVQEGQWVDKEQPLLRIKSEQHGIAGFELKQSLIQQHRTRINMLEQQITKQKIHQKIRLIDLQDQGGNLQQRSMQLDDQRNIFVQRVQINQDLVTQLGSLNGTGFISTIELQKQKDTLLSLHQQRSALDFQQLTINGKIVEINHQLAQLPIEQQQVINQLQLELAELRLQVASIDQQRLTEIRAPGAGSISGLLVKQGSSITREQNLLSIFPELSQMQAILYVPPSAIGFITKEQDIRLRYHAFPFEKFGIYKGKIIEVSANVILPDETPIPGSLNEPSYRVIVQLAEQDISAYARKIPLKSGMKLDADIIIERRSLLRWLFDPVFSIKTSS